MDGVELKISEQYTWTIQISKIATFRWMCIRIAYFSARNSFTLSLWTMTSL